MGLGFWIDKDPWSQGKSGMHLNKMVTCFLLVIIFKIRNHRRSDRGDKRLLSEFSPIGLGFYTWQIYTWQITNNLMRVIMVILCEHRSFCMGLGPLWKLLWCPACSHLPRRRHLGEGRGMSKAVLIILAFVPRRTVLWLARKTIAADL